MDALLHFQPLVLDLYKEVLWPEYLSVKPCGPFGLVILPFRQPLAHLSLKATREADQSFSVLGEKFLADPRFVVEAMHRGFRGDLRQVAIPFFVFRQQQKVVVGVAFRWRPMILLLADV